MNAVEKRQIAAVAEASIGAMPRNSKAHKAPAMNTKPPHIIALAALSLTASLVAILKLRIAAILETAPPGIGKRFEAVATMDISIDCRHVLFLPAI